MSLLEYLQRIEDALFWGELTIKFQNGKPVVINKLEQIKIESKQEAPSRNNHRDFHAPLGVGHGIFDSDCRS